MCSLKLSYSAELSILCVLALFLVTLGCSASGTPSPSAAVDVAQDGDIVAVHYTGTLDSGEVFDSSEGQDPLILTVGSGQVISGFDEAVRGLRVGETKRVIIPPEEAYGEYSDELMLEFPNSDMPVDLQVGDTLIFQSGAQGFVIDISDSTFLVDANHRLAGQTLTFEIKLVSIQ